VTHIEHLLTCLMEECAEVSQRVSKALQHAMVAATSGRQEGEGSET
jgi:hypothetical protein